MAVLFGKRKFNKCNYYSVCPVCKTNKFITYCYGTHAEGKLVVEYKGSHYVSGDCNVYELYKCDNCSGKFSLEYKIENGKTEYLKIKYNRTKFK